MLRNLQPRCQFEARKSWRPNAVASMLSVALIPALLYFLILMVCGDPLRRPKYWVLAEYLRQRAGSKPRTEIVASKRACVVSTSRASSVATQTNLAQLPNQALRNVITNQDVSISRLSHASNASSYFGTDCPCPRCHRKPAQSANYHDRLEAQPALLLLPSEIDRLVAKIGLDPIRLCECTANACALPDFTSLYF